MENEIFDRFVGENTEIYNQYIMEVRLMSYQDGFCSGLKPSVINILLKTYRLERKSNEKLEDYINFLKNTDNDEYIKFLEYKRFVEKRTPDLKKIYYDFLDGKCADLNYELFTPVNK